MVQTCWDQFDIYDPFDTQDSRLSGLASGLTGSERDNINCDKVRVFIGKQTMPAYKILQYK